MNAEDPIILAALARGFLTPELVEEAKRLERELSVAGKSPGLRALLAQRYLRPEHVAELRFLVSSSSSSAGAMMAAAAAAPPARRTRELAPGSVLGDYVVDGLLGRGGMGAVYAGRDNRSGVRVAVKVLLETRNPAAMERFRREGVAQAATDRHKNILRVLGSGEQDGMPFLVMELAEGGDLHQRISKGPLPVAEAAAIVAQLADGLAHVHAAGILHRDLKPSNVMFDAAGTPKLVDFGLAHLRDQDALTRTGDLLGTPAYMAPEQADGQRHAVDQRTDVYGLGAVFYHCVTGQKPFGGGSLPEVVRKVLVEAPPAPSSVIEGLPRDVDRIIAKALAKSSDERYQSAAAFGEDLQRLVRGESVKGRDPAAARRRARLLGTAAVALVSGLAVVGLWRLTARGEGKQVVSLGPPGGSLRPVHGDKATTRLAWITVQAGVSGDVHGGRLMVGDVVAAVGTSADWRFEGRVPLEPGPNSLRLEALVPEEGRDPAWRRMGDPLRVERLAAFSPPPPEVVRDRKGRELRLDEASETYTAHDGSVLVYVPPGRFRMGDENCHVPGQLMDGKATLTPVSKPVHQVTLTQGLLLGKHEASTAQLAAYLAANPHAERPPPPRHTGWQPDWPAVNVSWSVARDYCAWAGLEMPSEAQWEWAVRGPQSRGYPWGDDTSAKETRARLSPARGPLPVTDDSLHGASWVGALHLAGNAWEWVEDIYGPYDTVVGGGSSLSRVDPRNPGLDAAPSVFRILRGGGWHAVPGGMPREGTPRYHGAYRYTVTGDLTLADAAGGRVVRDVWNDTGFRVALTLDDKALPPR